MSNVKCVVCNELIYLTEATFIANGKVPKTHGIKRNDAYCKKDVPLKGEVPKPHWQDGK